MKTLASHFIKRWWGLYLTLFVIDTLFVAGRMGMEFVQGSIAFVCVVVFLNYLQKGGNGAFWLPLTRRQIGRVYWMIAVLFPTVIFAGSEAFGIWLADSENLSPSWSVLKHGVIFAGILSALIFTKKSFALFPLLFLLLIYWPKFLSESHPAVEIGSLVLSGFFIVMTFVRAEHFLVTRIVVSNPKPRLRKRSWPLWNLWKTPKQTGMAWILATTFWSIMRSYVVFIVVVSLLCVFTKFKPDNFTFIILVASLPSIGSGLFLNSNLRVARILPLSTNQLAGWLIGITFAPIACLGLLMVPIAMLLRVPVDSVFLVALTVLEGFLVLQTTMIFVGERGLRGAAAIVSTITILLLLSLVFSYFEAFTVVRLILSILISVPIAFLIHRHCLKVGSELYRPQKETPRIS